MLQLSIRIAQKNRLKFFIKKFFSAKKIFLAKNFFSRFGFVILIGPLFNPQNDIPWRRPCETRFLAVRMLLTFFSSLLGEIGGGPFLIFVFSSYF